MAVPLPANESRILYDALIAMDVGRVRAVLQTPAMPPAEAPAAAIWLADAVIAPALARIGDEWEWGVLTLSHVYMAARIIEQAVSETLSPVGALRRGPRVGIGVLEDYHALGKRIVQSVLLSAGRDVRDLGTALSPAQMVAAAATADIEILFISVLMFNKALRVRAVVDGLCAQGLGHVRVVVGGAPFSHDPQLFRQVGAHACGASASDALRLSRGEGLGGAP